VVQDCAVGAKPWVLLATILASSIAYIDESIVNLALPTIETDLATSAIVVQWLINAYTLSLSSLLLIGGAAGDRFGRRRLFIIGIIIFAAASVWCGFSPNVIQLISARVVQGVGAALLIPSSLAIIGATFAENERGLRSGCLQVRKMSLEVGVGRWRQVGGEADQRLLHGVERFCLGDRCRLGRRRIGQSLEPKRA
jgi:MFS family permease